MLGSTALARDLAVRAAGPIRKASRVVAGYNEYRERSRISRRIGGGLPEGVTLLEKDGFCRFPQTDAPVSEMIAAARSIDAAFERRDKSAGKLFFRSLLDDSALEAEASFLQVALDPLVLATLAETYGSLPYLESIELLLTLPEGGPLAQSQFLHQDHVDSWAVKQFVYINDVDEDEGPFTLLPKAASDRVPAGLPHYIPDELMSRHENLNQLVALKGDAGSRLLINVRSCYHYGSRSKRRRLAFVAYYNSGFGYYPRMRNWQLPFLDGLDLSAMQRRVLGLR